MTEEKDEKLEEIIEQKVQERLKEEKEKLRKEQEQKIEELKQELKQEKKDQDYSEENAGKNISRRGFLKGLGFLSVGALAASSPVSGQMRITSDTIEKDGQSIWQGGLFNTSDYLDLQGSSAMSGDLDLGTNSITNIGTVDGVDISSHVNSTSNPHNVTVSQLDTYTTTQADSNFAASGHSHNQLHDKYTNSEAQSAVDGATLSILSASSQIRNATVATSSDLPSNAPEGTQIYVQDEGKIYVEDGT